MANFSISYFNVINIDLNLCNVKAKTKILNVSLTKQLSFHKNANLSNNKILRIGKQFLY